MVRRRQFLRTTGTALATGALAGVAAGEESYSYEFVNEAVAPNPTEVRVDGKWAYAATDETISVVDVADPRLPVLVEREQAPGRAWQDVKLGGADDDVAAMAQDGDPGGIVLYDRSDPANLRRGRRYRPGSGTHNHFVDLNRDVAYLCNNDPFTNPRMVVVDVSDGLKDAETVDIATTREGANEDPNVLSVFRLADVNREMADAGINVCHEIFVEKRGNRHVAHVCFWDAGVISVDVTDPADPVALAHFNATEAAHVKPHSTAEFYSRYVGMPGNSHYSRPTPDGDYLFVGAEAYPDPTGTAIPDEHGGIKVFDLTEMNLESPLNTDAPTYDPRSPEPVEVIQPPKEPKYGALRTSHNFDFTPDGSRFYSAWYQGGIRAYDTSDPTDITEVASFLSPNGNAFWGADALTGEATVLGDDRRFTVGSDRNGKGLPVLELVEGDGSTAAPAAGDVRANRPALGEVFPNAVAERLRRTRPTGPARYDL